MSFDFGRPKILKTELENVCRWTQSIPHILFVYVTVNVYAVCIRGNIPSPTFLITYLK